MPARAKGVRWKKFREPGLLFISSLLSSTEQEHLGWINRFFERLNVMVIVRRDRFERMERTGGAAAGTILKLPGSGNGMPPITAFVGVLTNNYLVANADRNGTSSDGELAHAVDLRLGRDSDCDTRPEIYLAPLDPPVWEFPIRDIRLNDSRLIRLRNIKFTWPGEDPGAAVTEIASAVDRIVNGRETEK